MNKILSLLPIFFISFTYAQIKFEKGYLISKNDAKEEVFIKNNDWLNNPTEFTYKITETSPEIIGKISEIKEFQIYGYDKLVKYHGKIDYSSDDLQHISTVKNPEWRDKEVFLYEISNGKKKLYSYHEANSTKFFYADESGVITPLVYKEYSPQNNQAIYANEEYKNQLKTIFADHPSVLKTIDDIKYQKNDLVKIFNLYNNVTPQELPNNITERKQTNFNLWIKPGIDFSTLKLYHKNDLLDASFTFNELRYGLDIEYVLPFNKGKWSFFIEPSYHSIHAEKQSNDGLALVNTKVNFAYLELPIGARHYMYITPTSKISLSIKAPLLSIATSRSKIENSSPSIGLQEKIDINQLSSNFIFGIGYTYKNKFSVELSHALKRSLDTPDIVHSEYSVTAINIGYKIF